MWGFWLHLGQPCSRVPSLISSLCRPTIRFVLYAIIALSVRGVLAASEEPAVEHADKATPPSQRGYRFKHLTSRNGLAQNTVTALAQDTDGFIWLGTQAGLQRYDGVRFELYQNRRDDPHSLPSNLVTAVRPAADGSLWVATFPPAVAHFSPRDGTFRHWRIQGEFGFVRHILLRPDAVWVGTSKRVIRLPFEQLKEPEARWEEVFPKPVVAMLNMDATQVALVTPNAVFAVNDDSLQATPILQGDASQGRWTAAAHRGQDIWLANNLGDVIKLNTSTSETHLMAKVPRAANSVSAAITQMVLDGEHVWLGTEANGLVRINLVSGDQSHFVNINRDNTSIADNRIRSLMLDNSGLLWIGTAGRGVDRTPAHGNKFNLYRTLVNNSDSLDNDIRAIAHRPGEPVYYVATSRYRIYTASPDSGVLEPFVAIPKGFVNRQQVSSAALVVLDNRRLLYGSAAGLWKIDTPTRRITPVPGVGPETPIPALAKGDGVVWVGSASRGVGRYVPESDSVEWIPLEQMAKAGGSPFVIALKWSAKHGLLWIGTNAGLLAYDPSKKTFAPLPPGLADGGLVRTLYVDKDGAVWAGTLSGAFRLQMDRNGDIAVDRPLEGIPSLGGNIYAFEADQQGRLWISSNNGLTRVSLATGRYHHFTEQDGLQSQEFNGNASLRDEHGQLWFAGVDGLNSFYPAQLQPKQFRPPVWLTGYWVGDTHHSVRNPAYFNRLRLPYNVEFLKLEYAALDYAAPERNKYRIRLEGQSDHWTDVGETTEVAYTQLNPGSYSLHIMGSNSDGIFNPEYLALDIEVVPPWWRSNQAYLAYVATIALLILAWMQWRWRLRRKRLRELAEIRESRDQLKWALWGTGDTLWVWDLRENKVTRQGLEKILGYEQEQLQSHDTHLEWLIHPEDLPRVQALIERHMNSGSTQHFEAEYRMRAADGSWRWVLDRGMVVERDEQGRPLRIAGTFRDITEKKLAEKELQLAALVLQNMSELVLVTDTRLRIISSNPAFQAAMAVHPGDVIGKELTQLFDTAHDERFATNLKAALDDTGNWHGEIQLASPIREHLLVWAELSAVKDASNRTTHIVAVLTDITDKKKAEEELRYLANYDPLTKLPNRALFYDRLGHAILQAERQGSRIALLFIDLDNFKNINDSLGHDIGDDLLKAVAGVLKTCVRRDDTVCRLGGDEFTVILENVTSKAIVCRVAEKIIEAFSEPLLMGSRNISITPSIGISLFPDDASDAATLVKYADTAMYYAKSSGKNTYQFYAEEMNRMALRRLELENHLRMALQRDEFYLVYQPKFSLVENRITGVEALIRWRSPVLGDVRPDEFIYLAEETGLIDDIGHWVFREAARQLRTWNNEGYDGLTMAINLSARQFRNPNLAHQLKQILDEMDLGPECIILEITESLLMDEAEQTVQLLGEMQSMGFAIAIDDFGTGYSSLSYLKRFPINSLKIDRTFVRDVISDADDASITSAIIGLAHNLELTVVAEGVETGQQLMFLRASGCEEVQGYLISPPTSPEDIMVLLNESEVGNIIARFTN